MKKSILLRLRLLFSLVTVTALTSTRMSITTTTTVVSTIFSFNSNIHPLKHMFTSLNLMQYYRTSDDCNGKSNGIEFFSLLFLLLLLFFLTCFSTFFSLLLLLLFFFLILFPCSDYGRSQIVAKKRRIAYNLVEC